MNPFFIRIRPSEEKTSPVVISISNKVAPKAVTRNRIRRVVREILRTEIPPLNPSYQVTIVVKNTAIGSHQEAQHNLLALLKKSGMLIQ